MPKQSKHPRLRTHVRKGSNGQRWVYYSYDMRHEGAADIQLGKNYAEALVKWDELHNKKGRVKGTIEEAMARWEAEKLPEYESKETRRGYEKSLRNIRPAFGKAAWAGVKFHHLAGYLEKRSAKTQGNREISLLSIIWNQARRWGLTDLQWPAAGMERSGWKNREQPRQFEVTDEMYEAVHAEGDELLRDAMDIASATGLRITDVRTVPMPHGDTLAIRANKTGKRASFDISLSQVLPDLLQRRRANKRAMHLKLLTTSTGREVSYRMLDDRFKAAREAAAKKKEAEDNYALAEAIRGMILRDCRKYASDKADTLQQASELLQHSGTGITQRHYRTKATALKPVR